MSKFAKIIALMMAVLFTLSLVACGGDAEDNNDPTTAPTAQTETSDNVTTLSGETVVLPLRERRSAQCLISSLFCRFRVKNLTLMLK